MNEDRPLPEGMRRIYDAVRKTVQEQANDLYREALETEQQPATKVSADLHTAALALYGAMTEQLRVSPNFAVSGLVALLQAGWSDPAGVQEAFLTLPDGFEEQLAAEDRARRSEPGVYDAEFEEIDEDDDEDTDPIIVA